MSVEQDTGAPSGTGSREPSPAVSAVPASIPSAEDTVVDILARNLPFPRADMRFIARTILKALEPR